MVDYTKFFDPPSNVVALPRAVGAFDADPQQAAEALTLGRETGTPAPVIDAALPEFKWQRKADEAGRVIDGNPKIADYINRNPLAAKVSNDDYRVLDTISATMEAHPKEGFTQSVPRFLDLISFPEGRGKLLGALKDFPAHFIQGMLETVKLPGKVGQGKVDIGSDAALDEVIGLGTLVGFGRFSKIDKTGQTSGLTRKIDPAPDLSPMAKDYIQNNKSVPPGLDPVIDSLHIKQADLDAIHLDRVMADRETSATWKRSPEAFEDFVAVHTDQTISIPFEKIAEIYQKADKEPAPGDGLFGYVPDLRAKISAAAEHGGEIEIPLAQYIAWTEKAVHEGVKEDLRFRETGVTKTEAKELAKTEPEGFDVWHGSPHTFEAFSMEKLGTGEGAQSYGHGLYFAEQPKVAEGYSSSGAFAEALRRVRERGASKEQEALLAQEEVHKILDSGNLYRARIKAKKEDFLDFDKPLKEQGEVGKITKKWAEKYLYGDVASMTGQDAYKGVAAIDSMEAASKELHAAGIPGIKYLDQGSRKDWTIRQEPDGMWSANEQGKSRASAEYFKTEAEAKKFAEGTSNFVLFDDKLISILERNGEALVQAVKTEQKAMYLRPLFEDAKAVGMDKTQFGRYDKKLDQLETQLLEKAIALAERETKQRLTAEWKDAETAFRAEVEAELKVRTEFDALLRELEEPGVAPVLTPAATKRAVDAEVARRMEAKFGNLKENIFTEARDIAMSEIQTDILYAEIENLARQAGGEPKVSKAAAIKKVQELFERQTAAQAEKVAVFQRDVARAGKLTEAALLAGKFDEAFKAAFQRFNATLMAKEAIKFEKEVVSAEKVYNRIIDNGVIKSMDQGYLDQAHGILSELGYTDQQFQSPTKPLTQLVGESNGRLAIAHWITDPTGRRPDLKSFANLTVEEYRDLRKSIDSIMHVGKDVKLIESVHGKAALDNVVFDIKGELSRFNLIEQPLNPSVLQRVSGFGRWVSAVHLLVERMLDYTDKFNPNGPITTYLDRPLRTSYSKELVLSEQTVYALRNLEKYVDSSINDFINNKVIIDPLTERPANLTRKNLRHLILYMGSESGLKKVVEGFKVDQIVLWDMVRQNATKDDFAWVNGMWKIFDDLWVESAEMQRRYTGVAADGIKARSFKMKLKDGEIEATGGYAPIVYDKMRSNITGDLAAKGDLFDKNYFPAITPQAYTLPRTGYAGALDLNGTLISTKIQGMIHDISFRESVHNASKLINNAEFRQDMTKAWGAEKAGLLDGWLKDIANVHNVDDTYAMGAAHFFSMLRQNITATLIGFNPGTFIKHGGTALGMSAAQVGVKGIAKATVDVGMKGIWENAKDLMHRGKGEAPPTPEFVQALREVTEPGEKGQSVRDFILESSPIMRNRQRQYADTVRASYENVNNAGILQTVANYRSTFIAIGRAPVALSDLFSAMPTWYAAYKESFAKNGDKAQSVFEADRVTSRAHGSSFIGDKALVQRTGEPLRWVTPLYNFWNHMANNMMQLGWDISARTRGADEPGANVKSIGQRVILYGIIPIIIEEMATSAISDDKKGLGQKSFEATLRYFGSFFIGLRDITNALASGYEPSVGIVGYGGQKLMSVVKDIEKVGLGKTASKDWFTHLATGVGVATGMSTAQIGHTGTGIIGKMTGQEQPRSFNEYRQLIRTGHTKPSKH